MATTRPNCQSLAPWPQSKPVYNSPHPIGKSGSILLPLLLFRRVVDLDHLTAISLNRKPRAKRRRLRAGFPLDIYPLSMRFLLAFVFERNLSESPGLLPRSLL